MKTLKLKKINLIFILFISIEIFALNLSEYNLPTSKQGISDRNYNLLEDKRYSVLRDEMTVGIQKYNYYWRDAEDAEHSSLTPQTCKEGYTLFPKNKKQKKLLSLNNYHCYKNSFLKQWKKRFKQNQEYNIQVAVVLWTTPKIYRDEGCEGFYFPLQKRHLKEGCYPKEKHYIDYEDWIRFTAYTFGNYIDHYIVWNEVNLNNWADISTTKYPKIKMAKNVKFHMNRAFKIYTDILKRTINAVNSIDESCMNQSRKCKNFIYISLTHDWYGRDIEVKGNVNNGIKINWRNMNLLDYLWKEVGLDYDWSIAIHPYGEVYSKSHNALKFSTLGDLSHYQKTQIDLKKETNSPWLNYPQSRLFASEQNIGPIAKAGDYKKKARYICESYEVAMNMPEIIAITHNHFQDNVIHKTPKPTLHTMLPASVKRDLSDADMYETFRAYKSTSLERWGKTDAHYCCEQYSLGCK